MDLSHMSGEDNYKASLMPKYDEISLDGNYGVYKVKHVTQPKEKVMEDGKEKEKYPTTEIGKRLELVWLKVRRQLVESSDEGTIRQTNEHNNKLDFVTIKHFNGQKEETMMASLINGDTGKYPKMKVRQIIYALDLTDGHVYRVISKGMSNSMQTKPKEIVDGKEVEPVLYFDYIFNMGKDEHFYTQTNVMEAKEVKTKIGMKFYSNFSKGRDLTPEEMELVTAKMTEVHEAIVKYDSTRVTTKVVEEAEPVIDYDDGAAPNVDDIPF